MAKTLDQLRSWARRLKTDSIALWIAARDARTPLLAKIVATLVAAYALSPIDLIPDFVPVLGYLDDLLLLPLGIALAVWLIPQPLMLEFRARASDRLDRPRNIFAAVAIVLLWLCTLGIFGSWLMRQVT